MNKSLIYLECITSIIKIGNQSLIKKNYCNLINDLKSSLQNTMRKFFDEYCFSENIITSNFNCKFDENNITFDCFLGLEDSILQDEKQHKIAELETIFEFEFWPNEKAWGLEIHRDENKTPFRQVFDEKDQSNEFFFSCSKDLTRTNSSNVCFCINDKGRLLLTDFGKFKNNSLIDDIPQSIENTIYVPSPPLPSTENVRINFILFILPIILYIMLFILISLSILIYPIFKRYHLPKKNSLHKKRSTKRFKNF